MTGLSDAERRAIPQNSDRMTAQAKGGDIAAIEKANDMLIRITNEHKKGRRS